MTSQQLQYLAANRFAYGCNEQTLKIISDSPQQWLLKQLQPEIYLSFKRDIDPQWTSQQVIKDVDLYNMQQRLLKDSQAKQQEELAADTTSMMAENMMNSDELKNPAMKQQLSSDSPEAQLKSLQKQINAKFEQITLFSLNQGIESEAPFFWHVLDFFSNHFSVSAQGLLLRGLAPSMELETIAPNISGHFSDMLLAVSTHPAMLNYLDNVKSVGPDSDYAKKRKSKGLNENLGREILELHTLGVNGGYSQSDVTELSKALTGWTVSGKKSQQPGVFEFNPKWHQPGQRRLLNKIYAQQGQAQAEAILLDLANHPATAAHVCKKLLRHFIADQPDPAQLKLMVKAWSDTQGHLPSVIAAMLAHSVSWKPEARKLKTPREWLISVCRSCGLEDFKPGLLGSLAIMGQKPFNAGSPAGYKDTQQDWSGPSAMMTRIEWANHVSRFIKAEPDKLAQDALGPFLRESTRLQLKRAESKQQAITLLLMSPEFQRR